MCKKKIIILYSFQIKNVNSLPLLNQKLSSVLIDQEPIYHMHNGINYIYQSCLFPNDKGKKTQNLINYSVYKAKYLKRGIKKFLKSVYSELMIYNKPRNMKRYYVNEVVF